MVRSRQKYLVNCLNLQESANKSIAVIPLGGGMMKELVEVLAKALVDHPDEVVVTETEKDNATVVELRVSPTDMGKVIGKQGRIAKAIRSLVKAAASRDDKKVVVEIVQ